MRFIWLCLVVVEVLGYTPRLLITLDSRSGVSVEELAAFCNGRVIAGSEEDMRAQIEREDLSDLTHLIILASPVGGLEEFASKVFYDWIHLSGKREDVFGCLEKKIKTVPVTDADLGGISPKRRGQFYRLMEKVAAMLNDHQIPFWAISGTLLGAIRHQGMVPWDDDLDIIIPVEKGEELERLKRELDRNGLKLYEHHEIFYKIFFKNGDPIYGNDGSRFPWKYPFLDIFTVSEIKGKVRIVSHRRPTLDVYPARGSGKGWWLYPHEIEGPPLFCPFGPLMIPILRDAESALTREYGPDWRVVGCSWYRHATETDQRRVKVAMTDYSSPPYVK